MTLEKVFRCIDLPRSDSKFRKLGFTDSLAVYFTGIDIQDGGKAYRIVNCPDTSDICKPDLTNIGKLFSLIKLEYILIYLCN